MPTWELDEAMLVEPSDLARHNRDRALIEAHCAGDQSAFPVIVRDHYHTLLAQAHRRLGSRVEAEDAVQETFERAYRGLCRVNGEYRIGAWLRRILSNVCTDHAARREVQRALPERIGPRNTITPDASEQASDPVVFRAVQAALDALPATQRQTFWLYEMDGLSYPEVAEQLGISEDNARARVHRAKTTLRRTLARARDAVAAIIAVPAGFRVLSRDAKKLAGPVPSPGPAGPPAGSGGELAPSLPASVSGLHAGATNVAYAVTNGPVAELAASTGSAGPRAIVLLVASVATAVGMVATPAVTGSSGSANVSASPSVAAAAAADTGAPGDDSLASITASVVAPTVDVTPSTSPTTTATVVRAVDWIALGAEATDDGPRVSVGTRVPGAAQPGAEPVADPCPWLAAYPDVLAALPGKAPVLGTLDPATGAADSGVNLAFAASTTLRVAEEAGGPTTGEVPVTLRAQVCLEPGRSAIVADVVGTDGKRVQLRGALVMQLNDRAYLFRGSVALPDGAPTLALPWGLGNRFVVLLEVDPDAHTASLEVAFLGPSGTTLPTPDPTGPEAPDPATPDPATPPTPPTTQPADPPTPPTTPPTTIPDGSSGTGSPP